MKTFFEILKSLCKRKHKQSEIPVPKITAEQWLWDIHNYGACIISTLYNKKENVEKGIINNRSNLFYRLPENLKREFEIFEKNYLKKIKEGKEFKYIIDYSENFDTLKEHLAGQVKNSNINSKCVSILTPVFKLLMSKVPDAYIFDRNVLFSEFIPLDVKYGDKNDFTYEPYISVCTRQNRKLFKKIRRIERNKDKKIDKLEKQVVYTTLILSIAYIITFIFNKMLGIGIFTLFVIFFLRSLYLKSKISGEGLNNKKDLKLLFPKKFIDDQLIKSDHITLRLNIFFNEHDGINRFETAKKEYNLSPGYVQLDKAISISIRNDRLFETLFDNEEAIDPVMFFEKDATVTIPVNGLDEHPIFQYLIQNIDIGKLDIPRIIESYLFSRKTIKN